MTKRPSNKASRSSSSSKPKPRPRVVRPGDNTLEGKAKPFLKRIESKLDELESLRGSYMADCKVVREDVREIIGEAKDAGIAVKALKGLVEYRKLERKQDKIAADFDIDESAAYDQLVEALGPLGAAAARAAGYRGNDDNRDVRPRHMTQPGASATPPSSAAENGSERADEAELARLGRGNDPAPAEPPPAEPPADASDEAPPPTAH
jgi:uncharacterized protein (UPF0335 family)